MKTFVTGASGFIGSEVVKNLIKNGHQVLGLARSEESAKKIKALGAEVLIGELEDFDIIKKSVLESEDAIPQYFEWMSMFIGLDSPGTSTKTQTELNWKPSHIGLLEEMELHYF